VRPSAVGAEAASDTKSSSAAVPPGCSFELSARKIEGRAAPWAVLPISVAMPVPTQMSRSNGRITPGDARWRSLAALETRVVQELARQPREPRYDCGSLLAREPGRDELRDRG